MSWFFIDCVCTV